MKRPKKLTLRDKIARSKAKGRRKGRTATLIIVDDVGDDGPIDSVRREAVEQWYHENLDKRLGKAR